MGNESIEPRESQDGMYECPYGKSISCNQRALLCDQGKFEPHCIMMILRGIDSAVESKNEGWIKEGILIACHVLLHKGYLKKVYENCSSSDIEKEVNKLIEEYKKQGKGWCDIGFDFTGW